MFPSRDLNNSNQNANWQLAPVYLGKCMEIISGQQKDTVSGRTGNDSGFILLVLCSSSNCCEIKTVDGGGTWGEVIGFSK